MLRIAGYTGPIIVQPEVSNVVKVRLDKSF
jgi:hypothetical protein